MDRSPEQTGPIVVVGGGAAGLEFVTRLSRQPRYRRQGVVLVDRSLGHIWKPRLHEIATAMQSQAGAENSFVGHASANGYRFEPGVLIDVDPASREIVLDHLFAPDGTMVLPRRRIGYGALVLAVGSEENDFDTPGARAHCLFLNTPEQAGRIRDALLAGAFRVARGQQQELSVAVIGGGATGVELAAEIKHAMDAFARHEPMDPGRVRMAVVEASERLLSANPPEVSEYAAASLRERGVELLTGERVTLVDEAGLQLASGRRIEAQLRLWTAGIRGPAAFEGIAALPRSRSGRVQVDAQLRCQAVPDVYAIGDCAEWTDPATGRPAPYTAQIASAQARYLAKAFAEQARGRLAQPFRFEGAGAIVSLADRGAAGNLTLRVGRRSRDHLIQGLSARWLYALLYRRHEFAILGWRRGLARVLADWLEETYEPTIKLH
ncbi:NADH dehydrogenase [Burkholderiales bacterium 8X]|nr:NADH dehydrogenase [Burkholderiales bacterium 8X]